jgi:hypothetical protein
VRRNIAALFAEGTIMADLPTRDVLIAVLGIQKDQALYLQRLHGWIIAACETIEKHPALRDELQQHPTWNQGPFPYFQTSEQTIPHIDALIRRLSEKGD